ncbi:MAG: 4Fe-4S binding protein [bacterium]
MAARSFIVKSIPAFIFLVFTVFFGRFFCGWVCPLGSVVDGFDNVVRAKSLNEKYGHMKQLKFFLLVIVLVAAVFSLQLAGFVDPIPLFTRTMATFLYPLFVFIIDGSMGVLMSLGFLEDSIFRLNEWMRGAILPVHIITFQGSVLIALVFMGILLWAFAHKRFWCRNLCPLGALYGLFSKIRWYRRCVMDACTQCKLCYKNCRMGAIEKDFKSTNHVECINCFDCQKICPVHAIDFGFVKKPKSTAVDFSRRRLLAAGATGLLSVGILKTGMTSPAKKGQIIRPPGALDEPQFLNRCVRCGECVRICSTSGVGIQHAGLECGWEGIWTPILKPKIGYCEYNCNLCGQVCPTGAIHSLLLEKRQEIKMGTAHFDKTKCIPWYYGENCMVCEEHCPLPDKAIKFRESKVITIDGKDATVLLPYVEETLCIGCGICVNRCPVEVERGIFLTNAGETRWSNE